MAKSFDGPVRDRVFSIERGTHPLLRSTGDRLQLRERLRYEAAEVVRQVFPRRGLKRFGNLKYAVSRARNGCVHNPLYRLAEWMIALRMLLVPFAVVRMLLDFLNDLARLLWEPLSRDSVGIAREAQGALFRLLPLLGDYITGGTSRRRALIDAVRTVRGLLDELVLALQEDDWTSPGMQVAA